MRETWSMVMDFYELTMSNGYFVGQDLDTRVVFDVFYRANPDGADIRFLPD